MYDPVAEKLLVSRDVVIQETRPWKWKPETAKESTPSGVFTVVYAAEPGVTVTESGSGSPRPVAAETAPCTPELSTPPIQFVSPPSRDDALDTDSGHPRYRRVSDVYDTTKEITAPIDYSDLFDDDDEQQHVGLCFLAAEEPASVEAALSDHAWRKAMEEEVGSIVDNQTWELTSLPAGHRAIGLKWVFKVKRDPAGNILKHKARLVAKGYSQR